MDFSLILLRITPVMWIFPLSCSERRIEPGRFYLICSRSSSACSQFPARGTGSHFYHQSVSRREIWAGSSRHPLAVLGGKREQPSWDPGEDGDAVSSLPCNSLGWWKRHFAHGQELPKTGGLMVWENWALLILTSQGSWTRKEFETELSSFLHFSFWSVASFRSREFGSCYFSCINYSAFLWLDVTVHKALPWEICKTWWNCSWTGHAHSPPPRLPGVAGIL